MNHLHPGARWSFRLGAYFVLIILSFFAAFFIIPLLIVIFSFFNIGSALFLTLLAFISYILLIIIIAEIYARMAYSRWFYEFDEHGLRLERGIIWKRYSNVPYERIQNVDVHRGIIARIFGFSSVMIQTAGYSAQPYAEGYIPAVDMALAEQIRNFVMDKITKRHKHA